MRHRHRAASGERRQLWRRNHLLWAVTLCGLGALGGVRAAAQAAAGSSGSAQPAPAAPSSDVISRPLMPDPRLAPPPDVVPVLVAHGRGVQRYVCKPKEGASGAFEWVLKEPQAKLFDAAGHEIGSHSAGPAWQLADGSRAVKKRVVASFPALQVDGVPWLLVEIDASGSGGLAGTRYVQRIDTVGGAAAQSGCDAAHAGAMQDVEYRATYVFYGPPPRP